MEIAGADDMDGKPEVRVGKTRNRGDVARLLFGNCWYMGQTTQRIWGQKLGRTFGWLAAWAWTIIAGGGGLGLLIKTRATTADKRLVRPFLGYFSVSAHSVALEEIHRYCTLGLGPFRHRLSHYCGGAPGFENRRARHIPD